MKIDPAVVRLRAKRTATSTWTSTTSQSDGLAEVGIASKRLWRKYSHRRREILMIEEVPRGRADRQIEAMIGGASAEHTTHSAAAETAEATALVPSSPTAASASATSSPANSL